MMKLISGKRRLAGAVLLAGIMALAGPAFGQGNANVINTDNPDISGSYTGGLTISPEYAGSVQDITATLADNGTLNVTGNMSVESNEYGANPFLILGANSTTNVSNRFQTFGNAGVRMAADSELTVGEDFEMYGNSTFTMESGSEIDAADVFITDASELIMGDSTTFTSADDFSVTGRMVLGDNASVTAGTHVSLYSGGEIVLGDGAAIDAVEDFEISDGRVLLNNATITTNYGGSGGEGAGFNIGWWDDWEVGVPDEDGNSNSGQKGELIMSGNSTLNADGFISIKKNGVLRLEDGATAAINLYTGGNATNNGVFVLGNTPGLGTKYASEFGSFTLGGEPVDFDNTSVPGGLFFLGTGSEATITGRAVFGDVGEAAAGSTGLTLADGSYLKIAGDAWFLDNSMLTLESGSAALDSDIVGVTGQATIESGARVEVINGHLNDIILSAGSFATSNVFENPVYNFRIDSGNLVIDGMSADNAIESLGQNSNYAASTGLINNIFASGSVPAELRNRLADNLQQIGFAAADGSSLAEVAMKQLIGEEALAATSAVQSSMSQGNQALGKHFQALRGNSIPSAGAGDTENRLWVGGFGQWSSQDDKDNVYGYDYNSVGVMLGYDREVAALPGLTLGLNGSWNSGTVENNDGLAETDIDSFGLGIYGLYEFGSGFFMEADLGYGHAKNDSEIDLALGGKKSGDFDIGSFQAGLNLGYDYRFEGGAILTPSAGLRYTHIKQNGWRERIVSDPNNMAVANWFDDSTQNFLEIPVSLKLAKTFDSGGGYVITPELRVGAVFTATEPESSLRMGFVGSNDSVTIYGIEPGRNRFTAGAGIKAQLNDTVDLFAGYDLEARSGYMGHSASLGLGFSF